MGYKQKFYSRRENSSLYEHRIKLYEGYFSNGGEGYEIIKKDSHNNRFLTYYIHHQQHIFSKDIWNIEINVGPFAYMLTQLQHALGYSFSPKFTEQSVKITFRNYPVLKNYICGWKYNGQSIYFDPAKSPSTEGYGRLAISIEGGSYLSSSDEEKIVNHLVDFADKSILELSHLTINTKELVPIVNQQIKDSGPEMPTWLKQSLKVGMRVGIKVLATSIGVSASDFDIPDIDIGNAEIPDVDFSSFDLNSDFDFDFDDSLINDDSYNISFYGNTPPDHLSDGYIFQGGETYNGFQVYKKGGHKYYWDSTKDVFVKIS